MKRISIVLMISVIMSLIGGFVFWSSLEHWWVDEPVTSQPLRVTLDELQPDWLKRSQGLMPVLYLNGVPLFDAQIRYAQRLLKGKFHDQIESIIRSVSRSEILRQLTLERISSGSLPSIVSAPPVPDERWTAFQQRQYQTRALLIKQLQAERSDEPSNEISQRIVPTAPSTLRLSLEVYHVNFELFPPHQRLNQLNNLRELERKFKVRRFAWRDLGERLPRGARRLSWQRALLGGDELPQELSDQLESLTLNEGQVTLLVVGDPHQPSGVWWVRFREVIKGAPPPPSLDRERLELESLEQMITDRYRHAQIEVPYVYLNDEVRERYRSLNLQRITLIAP